METNIQKIRDKIKNSKKFGVFDYFKQKIKGSIQRLNPKYTIGNSYKKAPQNISGGVRN